MMTTLLILRGAPGSGKTTIAEALLSSGYYLDHWESDMFFYQHGEYEFKPERLFEAHQWCQEQTKESLRQGRSVIVSNTSCTEQSIEPYLYMADSMGIPVQQMILWETPFSNGHKVPMEKVLKMRQ